MGWYLYDANGYVGDLASNNGFASLQRSLENSTETIADFFNEGWTNKLDDLKNDLSQEELKNNDDQQTLNNLIELIEHCEEIAIISDGLEEDDKSKVLDSYLKKRTKDAEFKEEDHPRGQPNNKGQFVKKSEKATSKSEEKKEETKKTGEQEHVYIKAIKTIYKKVKGRTDKHEESAFIVKGELQEFSGEDGKVVFPEEAAKRMEYLVHNHPGGASFSDLDFQFFITHPVKRMDVITNDGKHFYTMEKTKEFSPESVFEEAHPYMSMSEYKKLDDFNILLGKQGCTDWRKFHDKYFPTFNQRFKDGEPSEDLWAEHTNLVMKDLAKKYKFKYERKEKLDFPIEDKASDIQSEEKENKKEGMYIIDDTTILTPTYEKGGLLSEEEEPEKKNTTDKSSVLDSFLTKKKTKDTIFDRFLKRKTKDSLLTTSFQGLPIVIENPIGSLRKHQNGVTKMFYPYGYIKKTVGRDGDEIDCFIGPNEKATNVFIVKLGKDDKEDKVMMGFDDERQARDAFLAHYDDFKFLGTITAFPVEQFKKVLEEKGMKGVNLTKDVLSILGGKQ